MKVSRIALPLAWAIVAIVMASAVTKTEAQTCGCASFTPIPAELGGQSLTAGCYQSTAAFGLTGTLVLNGGGLFIFSTPAALTTAAASSVSLQNGAACGNVNFCLGAAATLGASSVLNGNIVSAAAITLGAQVQVNGAVRSAIGVVTFGAGAVVSPCVPSAPSDQPPAPQSLYCACPAANIEHTTPAELGGQMLTPGCYRADAAFGLTGILTLSGAGAYYFTTPAAITTAAASAVRLIGGATCDDVHWCIGAAATLGASSTFVGALRTGPAGAITIGASAVISGSLVAGNSVVTVGAGAVVNSCGPIVGSCPGSGSGGSGSSPSTPSSLQCSCPSGCSSSGSVPAELGGLTLGPGCYSSTAAFGLTGVLTLSGAGAYVFSSAAAFNTAAASSIVLTNGATCAMVSWCIKAAATLGASSKFVGNLQTGPAGAITIGASAIIEGSLHAGNGVITVGAGVSQGPCGPLLSTPPSTGCGCSNPIVIPAELGGQILRNGCYASVGGAAFGLTGTLTLSGSGSFSFQTPAAITTAANSVVLRSNGASCSRIKWCIGAAATLGAGSDFVGALQTGPAGAITLGAGANVKGSIAPGNGVATYGAGAEVDDC